MEAMSRSSVGASESAIRQSTFYAGVKEERFKEHWWRYNAPRDLLRDGMPEYVRRVGEVLEQNPQPLFEDPLWERILQFALYDNGDESPTTLPGALSRLQNWRVNGAGRAGSERHDVTRDMAGCWYVFRLTSKRTEEREVTVSLLNILPEVYYEDFPSHSIEFSLTSRAEGDDPLVKVNGVCRHHVDQLHFIGVLAKRSAEPTAMALHYEDGDVRDGHRKSSKGVLFTTNSKRKQIAAPVVAVFIEGSDKWRGTDYDARKADLLERLGHFEATELSEIMPDWVYPHLLERSQKEMVYESQ